MAQEQYRGPKAADVMPAAFPGPAGLPPSDAPMLFTGDDPMTARKLMAAMWARAAPITDAVEAAYAAAQAGGSPAPASTEGQSIASEAEFVEATGALAMGLFQFDLTMGGWVCGVGGWWQWYDGGMPPHGCSFWTLAALQRWCAGRHPVRRPGCWQLEGAVGLSHNSPHCVPCLAGTSAATSISLLMEPAFVGQGSGDAGAATAARPPLYFALPNCTALDDADRASLAQIGQVGVCSSWPLCCRLKRLLQRVPGLRSGWRALPALDIPPSSHPPALWSSAFIYATCRPSPT
jgi:hypothetical protein